MRVRRAVERNLADLRKREAAANAPARPRGSGVGMSLSVVREINRDLLLHAAQAP